MNKLIDVMSNPSGLDSLNNYSGDIPDKEWYVVLTRSRDSDVLTESNWECALEELGGESETVEVHRFGHWACGWWEALAVKEGSEAFAIGEAIHDRLKDYPVLDENDFSERETEEADRVWNDCYSNRDRLKYVKNHRNQFEFHDLVDMLACIRGKYFAGCASELLN